MSAIFVTVCAQDGTGAECQSRFLREYDLLDEMAPAKWGRAEEEGGVLNGPRLLFLLG
jgi:hypothetical protein